ncbi:MAG: hypothetical protein JSS44_02060 [Proteobacteria bacterium]|nr:hypothetical protein [Pseudomonadota bacterium]MBS0461085.1 hypothetical protein [Pseudomonadota bacterium]
MGTRMIAVEGQLAGNPEVEALYIRDNRTWYSPPGGWMAAQSGKWEQISVAGMAVQGISGTPNVFMAGLVFVDAKKGDSGQLRDQAGGGVGTWKVTMATG